MHDMPFAVSSQPGEGHKAPWLISKQGQENKRLCTYICTSPGLCMSWVNPLT